MNDIHKHLENRVSIWQQNFIADMSIKPQSLIRSGQRCEPCHTMRRVLKFGMYTSVVQ